MLETLHKKPHFSSPGVLWKLHKYQVTSPWELMDPRTKNDSDKTQGIRMLYVGNGYVRQRVNSTNSQATTLCSRTKFDLLTPVPRPNEFLVH